jgi:3'-phosphoadenosine 5'-phosphosulfate (PAPS) 3'-phosphatase
VGHTDRQTDRWTDRQTGDLISLTFLFKESRVKSKNDSEIVVKASYAVSEIIAQRLKPYADSKFVEECLEVVGDIVCPEDFKYQSVAIYSFS